MVNPSDGRIEALCALALWQPACPCLRRCCLEGLQAHGHPATRAAGARRPHAASLRPAWMVLLVSTAFPGVRWSPWLQSQAGSGAGCLLPLPTTGQRALEHREGVGRSKMVCSLPAMRFAAMRVAQGVRMGCAKQELGAAVSPG